MGQHRPASLIPERKRRSVASGTNPRVGADDRGIEPAVAGLTETKPPAYDRLVGRPSFRGG
jgi:hypothetical protein